MSVEGFVSAGVMADVVNVSSLLLAHTRHEDVDDEVLAMAAICYAQTAANRDGGHVEGEAPGDWPVCLDEGVWVPFEDRRRALVTAAALLVAALRLHDEAAAVVGVEDNRGRPDGPFVDVVTFFARHTGAGSENAAASQSA